MKKTTSNLANIFTALLFTVAVVSFVSCSNGKVEKLQGGSNIQQNKATVTAFYDTAFNQKRPDEAVSRYVGRMYRQHNPNPQAFIDAVKAWTSANPHLRIDIKRLIAEGDLVVTHVHIRQHEKDQGIAAIDIFRLEDGKIVEHWDVTQAVPEKPANSNTMF